MDTDKISQVVTESELDSGILIIFVFWLYICD